MASNRFVNMPRNKFPPVPWRQILARSRELQARALQAALERNGWSRAATARELELSPTSLPDLIKAHGLAELYEQNKLGRGRPRDEQK